LIVRFYLVPFFFFFFSFLSVLALAMQRDNPRILAQQSAQQLAQHKVARFHARKQRRAQFAALGADLFFGWYVVIVMHRFVWHGVFSSIPAPALTLGLQILYCVIGCGLGVALNLANASAGRMIFGFQQNETPSWKRATALHSAWILGTVTIIAGWMTTNISLVDFFSRQGLAGAGRIFGALFTPEFSIAWSVILATIETIYLALMATLFALPASFVLSFFCARNIVRDHRGMLALYGLLRFVANLTRSIEPLIWAIVFSVWVGIGPFAGMLALAVHTVASLVKQYSEQIEDIESGTVEAIEATGASPLQVVWYAVVPQIILPFLSITIYRWDINVRMATVIGLVGGGGIGTLLVQYQGLAKWHEVGLIVLVIASVVWLMDYLTARIRQAIR
jgi:phosphonate transport system permease protein